VLARRGLQLLQFQLELTQQPSLALGTLSKELAPELLDLQLQACDQRVGAGSVRRQLRDLRLGFVCARLFSGQACLQFSNRGMAVFHTRSPARIGRKSAEIRQFPGLFWISRRVTAARYGADCASQIPS